MNMKGATHQVKEEKKATYFLFSVTLCVSFSNLDYCSAEVDVSMVVYDDWERKRRRKEKKE